MGLLNVRPRRIHIVPRIIERFPGAARRVTEGITAAYCQRDRGAASSAQTRNAARVLGPKV
jgi:hypothetical protein